MSPQDKHHVLASGRPTHPHIHRLGPPSSPPSAKAEARTRLPEFIPATLSPTLSCSGGLLGPAKLRMETGGPPLGKRKRRRRRRRITSGERGKGQPGGRCQLVDGTFSAITHQGSWHGSRVGEVLPDRVRWKSASDFLLLDLFPFFSVQKLCVGQVSALTPAICPCQPPSHYPCHPRDLGDPGGWKDPCLPRSPPWGSAIWPHIHKPSRY